MKPPRSVIAEYLRQSRTWQVRLFGPYLNEHYHRGTLAVQPWNHSLSFTFTDFEGWIETFRWDRGEKYGHTEQRVAANVKMGDTFTINLRRSAFMDFYLEDIVAAMSPRWRSIDDA